MALTRINLGSQRIKVKWICRHIFWYGGLRTLPRFPVLTVFFPRGTLLGLNLSLEIELIPFRRKKIIKHSFVYRNTQIDWFKLCDNLKRLVVIIKTFVDIEENYKEQVSVLITGSSQRIPSGKKEFTGEQIIHYGAIQTKFDPGSLWESVHTRLDQSQTRF